MQRLRRRLAVFRQVPAGERGLFLRVVLLLAAARRHVRTRGVPAARAAAARRAPATDLAVARLLALVAEAASVLPGAVVCLPRAVVLEALLGRAGHAAQLRIGVALREGAREDGPCPLEAHAWVEVDGEVVGEDVSRWSRLDHLAGPREPGA